MIWLTRVLLPAPNKWLFAPVSFGKDLFIFFKNISRLLFPEYVWKILSKTKCVLERIFQNGLLPYGFPILETHFPYKKILIWKQLLLRKLLILESQKIIKNNSDITKNVRVQEEKCMGAGRNIHNYFGSFFLHPYIL